MFASGVMSDGWNASFEKGPRSRPLIIRRSIRDDCSSVVIEIFFLVHYLQHWHLRIVLYRPRYRLSSFPHQRARSSRLNEIWPLSRRKERRVPSVRRHTNVTNKPPCEYRARNFPYLIAASDCFDYASSERKRAVRKDRKHVELQSQTEQSSTSQT